MVGMMGCAHYVAEALQSKCKHTPTAAPYFALDISRQVILCSMLLGTHVPLCRMSCRMTLQPPPLDPSPADLLAHLLRLQVLL